MYTVLFTAAALLAIISIFPSLDISFSHFFYLDQQQKFILQKHPLVTTFVKWYLPKVIISLFLINAFVFYKKQRDKVSLFYLMTCLVLGPGLVVNSIAKNIFERPRPLHIEQFQGKQKFRRSFQLRALTPHPSPINVSFPSGHAGIGFAFYAFAFLDARKRKQYIILSTLMGLLVGAARIAHGKHFLSDVLFAGVLVYLTCLALHYLIVQRRPLFSKN